MREANPVRNFGSPVRNNGISNGAKIIKVSGPLVVAEGCLGAKMYDMVRVSNEKLIGEIVELKKDLASIQVYEETSGIGPGEPVYLTGEPLCVELGPGLVGSIYDGIQRPMDIIRLKTGDFVGRGVEIPALNREKRWHFKPKLKSGDLIEEGDILGEVQETPLVTQKILIPPAIKGKILEIYEGDFKVEDTIAKIESEGKIFEIKMFQKWPVRRERPVREKLQPDEPLVTGQRVIDTLFPIAKGGTGCIPGPFGSGKCVSGETPVLLGDGRIKKIKDIFEESICKGESVVRNNETIVQLKEPLIIFTLSEEGIVKSKTNILYKGKCDSLIRIKTRSGRLIEVTPIHKLFKITERGEIIQTEAKDLRIGDFISSVRRIKLNNSDAQLNPYLLKNARVADKDIKQEIATLLRLLIREKRLQQIGLSPKDIHQFAYDTNLPTVELVEKIYKFLGLNLPTIKTLRGTTGRGFINIPSQVTPELAEFIGLFIAEGYIRKSPSNSSVVFTNSNINILNRFIELTENLFGVRCRVTKNKNRSPSVVINRSVLADFLKEIRATGISYNKRIPPCILVSSDTALYSFLKGYYLSDGSFFHGDIELSTASRDLQIGLSYILTRLGIFHILSKRYVNGKDYFRIFIRGIENLKIFCEAINSEEKFDKIQIIKNYVDSKNSTYTSYEIVPLSGEFIQNLYKNSKVTYTELKNQGIEISNYTTNQENMSSNIFRKFVDIALKDKTNHLFKLNNLLDYIFYDRIVSIKEMEGHFDVYDFSIPGTENFIGGWGGVVLHNTVFLHEVAKWSDADIIVSVACGERGNEVCDLLLTLPELKDPKTGRPLMEKTIVIANTSNMPVAAREASIYTGITIAEYFRDMGYSVALMADSTSRWAEALREISGRLEEMPGEEGYPAYLSTRVAEFYERAGKVICLGNDQRTGSLTAMGAVSPPGGDISDPVVQATLRVVKTFWGLDDRLASSRHFPAINWLLSYSLYHENIREFLKNNISEEFLELKREAMKILEEEAELLEIARLVGIESLSFQERLTLETAKSIREDFLHQNAFHEIDTYTSLKKQYLMLKIILEIHKISSQLLKEERDLKDILTLPLRERIPKIKYILEDNLDEFQNLEKELKVLR